MKHKIEGRDAMIKFRISRKAKIALAKYAKKHEKYSSEVLVEYVEQLIAEK